MIISVSGVDCAGKSTQIELLRQYFISQGKRCKVFWYRPGYSQEFQQLKSFARKCISLANSRTILHRELPKQDNSNQSNPEVRNKVPAPLWLTTAMIDTLLQWGIRLRILERQYDVVICDRYIRDACLDIIFKYPEYIWSETIFKMLSLSFPKPQISLLLWLPYEKVLERAALKSEPFPDEPHIREMRWHAYNYQAKLSNIDEIKVIDCSGTIEQTHEDILEIVKSVCCDNVEQL